MADETPSAVSKTWSDERVYFTAFWIGVTTCAVFQGLFVALAFLCVAERIESDEKFFVLKLFRNACTAMPIAGFAAAVLAVLTRWKWKLTWILILPAVCSALIVVYLIRHSFLSDTAWAFLAAALFLLVISYLLFSLLRKMCDSEPDTGVFYVLLMLIVCETLPLLFLLDSVYELRRQLNVASVLSLSVVDGAILIFIRKLQRHGLLSASPASFHFSLRALMILVLTAGAWTSLIVTLHRKPNEHAPVRAKVSNILENLIYFV